MRRILVTSGAGFIGANFCHYWTTTHPEDRVVVLDALTYAGNRSSIERLIAAEWVRFVQGDIIELDQVTTLFIEERIDTVINLAAESHVDRSIEHPHLFLRTNVMGTHALLEAARRAWTRAPSARYRFHHISTDEVYGSRDENEAPSREGSPYAPNSPYAASKAGADHLVRAYVQTYGLPSSVSHCSNNYGPYQLPEKLVPLCLLNILEGRTLPIYGDGLQLRNWIHVHDHCRAIDAILNNSPPGEVWNVGSASSEANLTVVRRLCDHVDQEFAANADLAKRFPQSAPARGQKSHQLITHVRDRPGRPALRHRLLEAEPAAGIRRIHGPDQRARSDRVLVSLERAVVAIVAERTIDQSCMMRFAHQQARAAWSSTLLSKPLGWPTVMARAARLPPTLGAKPRSRPPR